MTAVATNAVSYAAGGIGTTTLDVLEEARAYNRWIVDLIRPRLGALNIEVGAGQGTLSEIVGQTHDVLPFEISPDHQAVLRRRFHGHPRVAACGGDIMHYCSWSSIDCIYSANVLEHVPDDLGLIRHCARLLKPKGWFVALVPAGEWLYSEFDRSLGHHRRYGRADRERLTEVRSEGARLVLRQFRFVNPLGALGWFVNMRLRERQSVSSRDVAMVEWLMPLMKILDSMRVPFGQSALIALERVEQEG